MLKIGLVGVGGISGAHIPAWKSMENTELVAICDIRPERLELYPEFHHYLDFNEMLIKEDLDILDICLPTYMHPEFSIKAMEHGINVITEKPISLNKEDVARIYATAEKMNVKFMVAHVLRFWPEYELVKQIYDTGKYGKLLSGSMSRLGSIPKWSWDNWMADENRSGLVPFDLHIHDSDFMVYAFGAPKKTTSFRAKNTDQDYINAVYQYDEFFITTESSWYASPYPFRATFRFQFENAVVANEAGKMTIYERGGKTYDSIGEPTGDTGDINLPKSDGYKNELRYFADCVEQNKPVDMFEPHQFETVLDILNNL